RPKRPRDERTAGIGFRILYLETTANQPELQARLLRRDSGTQPAPHLNPGMDFAVLHSRIGLLAKQRVDVGRAGQLNGGRRHADDGVWLAFEDQRRAGPVFVFLES